MKLNEQVSYKQLVHDNSPEITISHLVLAVLEKGFVTNQKPYSLRPVQRQVYF